jgi:hypothetical protein
MIAMRIRCHPDRDDPLTVELFIASRPEARDGMVRGLAD